MDTRDLRDTRRELSGLQKAAVFLIALGAETAAEVFRHLRPAEADAIVREMTHLRHVGPEVQDRVLAEFQELIMAQQYIDRGGIDYARQVLERLHGIERANEIIERILDQMNPAPFHFLAEVDPAQLLNFVQNEHPQTIALILCYLPPLVASRVLTALPDALQAEVARRIAEMGRIAPETIKEIENVLRRRLEVYTRHGYGGDAETGGVDAIVQVLNLADRASERTILAALEEENPELAEEIRQKMLTFDDLIHLDDRSMKFLLRQVHYQDLVRAMKDTTPELQEHVLANLSKRHGATLQEDVDLSGPMRRREIEEAQQRIVAVVRRLEESGDVKILRPGDGEIVY